MFLRVGWYYFSRLYFPDSDKPLYSLHTLYNFLSVILWYLQLILPKMKFFTEKIFKGKIPSNKYLIVLIALVWTQSFL